MELTAERLVLVLIAFTAVIIRNKKKGGKVKRDSNGRFISNYDGPIVSVFWWPEDADVCVREDRYVVQVITASAKPLTLYTESISQALSWVSMFSLAKAENYYFKHLEDDSFVFKKPNSKKVVSAYVSGVLLDEQY